MKNIREDEPFTQDEILECISNSEKLIYKAFISLSYLTGGRVSEIVRTVKKKHISYRKFNGRNFMIITLPYTKKHPKHPPRKLPTPIDKEGKFVEIIEKYISKLKSDDVLFPFSRITGWKIIKKYTGERHHWLRHCRISHLITLYNYNDQELVKFAGWSNSKPLEIYAHLRTEDLMKKM